jgi:hypothetical protein
MFKNEKVFLEVANSACVKVKSAKESAKYTVYFKFFLKPCHKCDEGKMTCTRCVGRLKVNISCLVKIKQNFYLQGYMFKL